MALSEDCKGRLFNFKFEQAIQYLDNNATKRERDLIYALSNTFGNPGWFDGAMSTVIWAALDSIRVKMKDPA